MIITGEQFTFDSFQRGEYGDHVIIHADCRTVLPKIPDKAIDLVLTDPPYGIKVNTNWVDRKNGSWAKPDRPIVGDDKPFDPSPLVGFSKLITWGANHYANKLPPSADWLVWDKRRGATITRGWNAPDCELAWSNIGSGCRYFSYLWEGYKRDGEIGEHYHPTQKPIALMTWCISLSGDDSSLILDPFLGSGTTLVAAKNLGRRAIGVEINYDYCKIAEDRLRQEVLSL